MDIEKCYIIHIVSDAPSPYPADYTFKRFLLSASGNKTGNHKKDPLWHQPT